MYMVENMFSWLMKFKIEKIGYISIVMVFGFYNMVNRFEFFFFFYIVEKFG